MNFQLSVLLIQHNAPNLWL